MSRPLGVGDIINGDQQILGMSLVSDDPEQQVQQVIDMMRRYVRDDYTTPQIQRAVLETRISSDPVYNVFRHGKQALQFVRDEESGRPVQNESPLPVVETLVRPRDMAVMRSKRGDCDDYCMYGAALLLAQDIPTSFVTVAADPSQPDAYSHVYLAAYPKSGPYAGQRVPVDISHGPYVGWETPHYIKRREWEIGGRFLQLAQLGVTAWIGYLTWKFLQRSSS